VWRVESFLGGVGGARWAVRIPVEGVEENKRKKKRRQEVSPPTPIFGAASAPKILGILKGIIPLSRRRPSSLLRKVLTLTG
jgi:hypothetical protein